MLHSHMGGGKENNCIGSDFSGPGQDLAVEIVETAQQLIYSAIVVNQVADPFAARTRAYDPLSNTTMSSRVSSSTQKQQLAGGTG